MGNIGSISSAGKLESSVATNYKEKIIRSSATSQGVYIACDLPSHIYNVSELITHMINDCPYYLYSRNRSSGGVNYTDWEKVTTKPCYGIAQYQGSINSLYNYYIIVCVQSYTDLQGEPVDFTRFNTPTTLTVRSVSANSPAVSQHTINSNWVITDL